MNKFLIGNFSEISQSHMVFKTLLFISEITNQIEKCWNFFFLNRNKIFFVVHLDNVSDIFIPD